MTRALGVGAVELEELCNQHSIQISNDANKPIGGPEAYKTPGKEGKFLVLLALQKRRKSKPELRLPGTCVRAGIIRNQGLMSAWYPSRL